MSPAMLQAIRRRSAAARWGGGEKSNSIYVTGILMACKRYTLFVTVTIIVEKFN